MAALPKNVHDVASLDAFNGFVLTAPEALHVVFLWASFHEPSKPGGQMDTVVNKLAEVFPAVHFAKVSGGDGALTCPRGGRFRCRVEHCPS